MREWHGWRGPSRSEDIRGTMDIAIGTDHQLYMTRDDLTIGVMTSFEGPQTDSKPSSWVDMNLGTTIALLCDGLVRFLLPLSCPFLTFVKPINKMLTKINFQTGFGTSWRIRIVLTRWRRRRGSILPGTTSQWTLSPPPSSFFCWPSVSLSCPGSRAHVSRMKM